MEGPNGDPRTGKRKLAGIGGRVLELWDEVKLVKPRAADQFPVSAFYKGESQQKRHLRRLERAGMFAVLSSPSYVESGLGFLALQIHLVT
jgi:hypothetical protein